MAKRSTPEASRIYAGVDRWRVDCLEGDGSLFTPDRSIWSLPALEDLKRHFIDRPDTSKASFMDKFERQLAEAPDTTVQLAAEVMWVHLSIASSVRGVKKREIIQQVLGWMSATAAIPGDLARALDGGLCNPGLSFNTHRPFHIAQIVEFALAWKGLEASRRTALLRDPFAFKEFLDGHRTSTGNTQWEALLHLIHPDSFEDIVSPKHKRLIAAAFADRVEESSDDVDREILEIRRALETEAGGPINFYTKPYAAQWRAQDRGKALASRDPPKDLAATLNRWYPDPDVRRAVLNRLGQSVETAHACAERAWALNAFPRRIQLNVGRMRVLVLREDRLRIVVDSRRLDDELKQLIDQDERYKVVPDARDLVIPSSRILDILPRVVDAHAELIRRAAATAKRSPYARQEPAELFELLERELGRSLPRPSGAQPSVVSDDAPEIETPEETGLDLLEEALYLEPGSLERAVQLLEDKSQAIFYGPPGTGKTFIARKLAAHLARDGGSVALVQFHPSYSYEDFVEGYRPTMQGGQSGFALREGPLRRAAARACSRPDRTHVLIIDELNRGNLAKVFGELYFLLEYRDERAQLLYSDALFSLPRNLWVIGTMNTADRSIALVDLALRRRFHFVPFFPDEAPIQGLLGRWLADNAPDMEWVADLVELANQRLDDREVAIGPSYFLREDLDEEWLDLVWTHSVLPYLGERFVGDEARLTQFQLDRLRAELERRDGGEDIEGAGPTS